MIDLNMYKQVVDFLGLYLGKDTEILLCDLNNILLVRNPHDASRKVGAPLDEMQQAIIKNPKYKDWDHVLDYRSISSRGDKIRSATLFIRTDNNDIVGLLTINQNVTKIIQARDTLDILINGELTHTESVSNNKKGKDNFEALTLSVSDVIDNVLDDAIVRFNSPISRLHYSEKLSIIREMDKRGVFLAKGSVSEVADKLYSSKATIYRYLNQLDNA